MGEIADDHFVELFWSEGVGVGGDCGNGPPCEHPAYGGMNSYIARRAQAPNNAYRCKFCGADIGFINRLPYNISDGLQHRCLADARRASNIKKETQ